MWTGNICQTRKIMSIMTNSQLLFFFLAVRILWKFDNDLTDFYSNFPGVPIENPSYQSSGINGYGSCLYLNASRNQSVTIHSPPFLNMAYTSFSLVAWVKATTLRNGGLPTGDDNAIFGQYENNTQDRSLHIIVRQQRIYLGFYNDDIQGNKTLYPNNWYHVSIFYILFLMKNCLYSYV